MKTLLLSIILCLASGSFAQAWGRPGATWHYTKTVMGDGYATVKYTGDTLINGHNCQKIKATLSEFIQTNPQGDMVMLNSNMGQWYTYVSGDTVFYKTETGFNVLYNFAAENGDEWVHNVNPPNSGCDDTSAVRVTSTGTMNIDGQNLDLLNIEQVANSNIAFNYGNPTTIVSRIGNIGGGFLFPFIQQVCDSSVIVDYYLFSFRCYEDNEISYNPDNLHCAYFLGIEENELLSFSVAPNPANDVLHITTIPGNYTYEIVSMSGQTVQCGTPDNNISIASLGQGLYLLKMTDGDGKSGVVRFLKN